MLYSLMSLRSLALNLSGIDAARNISTFSCIRSFTTSKVMSDLLMKRIFCVEHRNGPMYMRVCEKNELNGKCPLSSNLKLLIEGRKAVYISAFLKNLSFAKNIERHEQLRKLLDSSISGKLIVHPGITCDGESLFERGYFVTMESTVNEKEFDAVQEVAMKSGLLQGECDVFDILLSEEEVHLRFRNLNNSKKDPLDSFRLAPTLLPETHPAFTSPHTNSVYHDIQRCYDVLQEFEHCEEIIQLLKICNNCIQRSKEWRNELPLKAINPVIVIEGLDATGKTTLTKSLGEKLNATVLKSPPECICHLRSKFDSHPQLLKRAFYSLGNYASAAMIQDAAKRGPVIVDRFWNSTAAYAIATDVGVGGVDCLPPTGHKVYFWPSDLLRPDAVFLLTVADEERRKRLLNRGSVKTDEEIRLERSSPFRLRLEEAYSRMENPKMQTVDASGAQREILNKTLELLASAGYISDRTWVPARTTEPRC